MVTTITPRNITPDDLAVAKRLRQIFELKKSTEGLTQVELAKKTGLAQPTINRLLAGKLALRNYRTLVKIATALSVTPEDIDPANICKDEDQDCVSLATYKLTGEETKTADSRLANPERIPGSYLIRLDKFYTPILPDKALLIADPNCALKNDGMVVIQTTASKRYFLYRLENVTSRSLKVNSIYGGEIIRERLIRTRADKNLIDEAFPIDTKLILLRDILSAHAIRGIEFPNQ